MRVSTDKDDREGYANWSFMVANNKEITILFDGVKQDLVEMADEEAGKIDRFVPDADGHIQFDPNTPDTIWRETVRGQVKIIIGDYQESAQ